MWVSAANYVASHSTNVFCWSPVTSTRNGLRCCQLVLPLPGWSLTSSHLCLLAGVFTTNMGAQLISTDFASFMEEKGIKHVRTALYHPQVNGGVERFNQTLRNGLRAHLARGSSTLNSTAQYPIPLQGNETHHRQFSSSFIARALQATTSPGLSAHGEPNLQLQLVFIP